MAVDGITGAKFMISLLGTPYSKYDCVNAAVIQVIRQCPGGDKSYRTAGCTELWNSINSSGKYHHIVQCLPLEEAKAQGMLIGDLPVIYNAATGICEHIGYYMGGYEGYEVIHSSYTKGEVCATYLKNGFTHVLRHRDIAGRQLPQSAPTVPSEDANTSSQVIVNVDVDSTLNLRSTTSTSGVVLARIPYGTVLNVLGQPSEGWLKVSYNGRTGYVSKSYTLPYSQSEDNDDVIDDVAGDCEPDGEGTWGMFVPCNTKEEAYALSEYFAFGFPCQRVLND